jgi:hypothetical protein
MTKNQDLRAYAVMVEDFTAIALKKRDEERKSLFLLKLMPNLFNSGLITESC